MTEIEAIKARHSVRNYEKKKIEPEKQEQLKSKIDKNSTSSSKLGASPAQTTDLLR